MQSVGDYLLLRLQEIGIGHLFGVPGDYNLQFLDHVIASKKIAWAGSSNELNAAYAADGYARCRGAAALLTTFGVGELSALNGVAGSYAEYLPVIHIVGAPASAAQEEKLLLHHTLGDGDYAHFLRIAREVTVAQAVLTRENAAAEIDRLLITALREHRPVYLFMPTDVAEAPIQPPIGTLTYRAESLQSSLDAFSAAAEALLAEAESVSLLADFLADRAAMREPLHKLVTATALPFSTLLMGKSVLPEQQPGFVGTYSGAASAGDTQRHIEQRDVVITVGTLWTDTITAGFTQHIDPLRNIDIGLYRCRVGTQTFSQIAMKDAVAVLHQLATRYGEGWRDVQALPPALPELTAGALSQNAFWRIMQDFLRPGDIVLADQGTAAFGAAALRLPEDVTFICQPLWGSIGFTLPAAWGAQLACPARRVILLCGDGAAQLTIQELGSMLRDGLKPIVFILNNDGYTVERAIHGEHQRYNDIAQWNWTQLPQALSTRGEAQSWRVEESAQLQEVVKVIEQTSRLSLVEVMLPQLDVPPLLQAVTAALDKRNAS